MRARRNEERDTDEYNGIAGDTKFALNQLACFKRVLSKMKKEENNQIRKTRNKESRGSFKSKEKQLDNGRKKAIYAVLRNKKQCHISEIKMNGKRKGLNTRKNMTTEFVTFVILPKKRKLVGKRRKNIMKIKKIENIKLYSGEKKKVKKRSDRWLPYQTNGRGLKTKKHEEQIHLYIAERVSSGESIGEETPSTSSLRRLSEPDLARGRTQVDLSLSLCELALRRGTSARREPKEEGLYRKTVVKGNGEDMACQSSGDQRNSEKNPMRSAILQRRKPHTKFVKLSDEC